MAQKTVTYLVDDLEGGDAAETVKFGLDGVDYEIDLSEKNATALRDSVARFVAAGRRIGRTTGKQAVSRPRGQASTDREQNKAIREWAKRKGLTISERGRISQEIVDQYHAEAGRSSGSPAPAGVGSPFSGGQ
ncbi:MAG: Lsr2 family protein [Micromonosporaceae bacterium]|nr:Lsr2 family protein [Micromonosporaceae bacterium]